MTLHGGKASVCVVLHGHLPWVHHPEHPDFLEEDWFFEALVDCYLPLLFVLDDLHRDRVPARLAVGLTPPLLEMFRAPVLMEKAKGHLDRRVALGRSELSRIGATDPLRPAAEHHFRRALQMRDYFASERGDLVGAFRRHVESGVLEILASCATHAVLPLVLTPEARRVQIAAGVAAYREAFGRRPAGWWLPECAFTPGLDAELAAHDLSWTILETHAALGAEPTPPFGVHRPLTLPSGLRAFARDPESSRQVWSSTIGYPGDPDYRELYRDVGFDAPWDYVKPWLHSDGIRRNLGFKYHRVTGRVELHEKRPWDPAAAKLKAAEHARHFVHARTAQIRALAASGCATPVVTAPYDLELFGHWWYEGPWWLEQLFREAARLPGLPWTFATPSDTLRDAAPESPAAPPLSTWGRNGFLEVWLNDKNTWILRHQHELERRMIEAARAATAPTARERRLLDLMARELLLLQSSDWAFILTMDTAAHYAEQRARTHADRFHTLESALRGASVDEAWIDRVEADDALFPGLSFEAFRGEPITKGRLGTPARPSRDYP